MTSALCRSAEPRQNQSIPLGRRGTGKGREPGTENGSELFVGMTVFPRATPGADRQVEVEFLGQAFDPRLVAIGKSGGRGSADGSQRRLLERLVNPRGPGDITESCGRPWIEEGGVLGLNWVC